MTLLHKIYVGCFLIVAGFLASNSTQAQTTASFQDTIVFENGVVWLCNVISLTSNSIQIEKAPQYGQGLYWANFNNIKGLRGPTARKVLPPDMYQAISSYGGFYTPNGYLQTSSQIGNGALNNGSTNYLPAEAPLTSKHMAYNAIYTPLASVDPESWRNLDNSIDITIGANLAFGTYEGINDDVFSTSSFNFFNSPVGKLNIRTKIYKRLHLLASGGLTRPAFSPNIRYGVTGAIAPMDGYLFMAYASFGPSYRIVEHKRLNIYAFGTVGYVHHYMSLEVKNQYYGQDRTVVQSTGANSACYTIGSNFQLMIPNQNGWYLTGEVAYYYSDPKFNLTRYDFFSQNPQGSSVNVLKTISTMNLSIGFGLYF